VLVSYWTSSPVMVHDLRRKVGDNAFQQLESVYFVALRRYEV